MIINSIKLENIRSYLNETIQFSEGNVLLAGDIGSGKSTILLALEFALFGLSKGILSGDALLRKGKREGSVEVNLEIGGKQHIIKRTLKNVSGKTGQSSGYIIADDVKKEGTAQELKSHILTLLNYPKDLLTKKSLIFRYTVYTPQEAMKKILLDDKEARLDTLRKVFQFDKYKKIRDNTAIYIKHLKEKLNLYKGLAEGIEDKKAELNNKQQELAQLTDNKNSLLPRLKNEREILVATKHRMQELEKNLETFHKIKKNLLVNETSLKEKIAQREKNNGEVENIQLEMQKIRYKLSNMQLKKPVTDILQLKEELVKKELLFNQANNELQQLHGKRQHLESSKQNILDLDECPTCRQPVSDEHKKEINLVTNASLDNLSKNMDLHKTKKSKYENELKDIRQKIELAQKQEHDYQVALKEEELLTRNTTEKQERINAITQTQAQLKQEIGMINTTILELSNELSLITNVDLLEEQIKKERQLMEDQQQSVHTLDLQIATIEQDIKNREEVVNHLVKEVEKKEKARANLQKVQQYHTWLGDFFIQLMSTMEKHVMLQVHSEFNTLFQEWFNILLPDENISIRLDDEFTPVIEQNGYEVELDNMSGGEKTAVSLAYRLALNKVINNLIQNINTKDLLILDEPTDGFSTEQLDRVREVLDQLGLKQVIIVSHENKIESFVENTIRIEKNEHVSKII
jgi:exonuclease SbcC